MKETIKERIKGCLVGACIGAEIGFLRHVKPELLKVENPEDILNKKLDPVFQCQRQEKRINYEKMTPLIDAGVRAYTKHQGRITPEDFAEIIKNDEALAAGVFNWDDIHTVQEILKEGTNPRISAIGIVPTANICVSMPGVGIYHAADPEYAYLDGVELASVVQCRKGADWAGLCAATIASCLDPDKSIQETIDIVLKIAHRNARDVFYQMNKKVRWGIQMACSADRKAFLDWWYFNGGHNPERLIFNPLEFILPLLPAYGNKPEQMFALINVPYNAGCHIISPIAGAIIGALNGYKVFPERWLKWAMPVVEKWFPIIDVVEKRLKKERKIISIVEKLEQPSDSGSSILFDKIYGAVLAGAIGNAMGSPVECWFYWEIDRKYPGGIKTVLDPARLESEDDNQMAMLLFETYIERKGLPVMARHFGEMWINRLNRDHFYAMCMGNAYNLIVSGWDPRITGHWSVVTGSTVMCMEPVGMYHIGDSQYASIDAKAISYMYQRGLDVIAAEILASAVSEALTPDATVESVCKQALKFAPSSPLETFDTRDVKSCRQYLEKCLDIASKYDDVLSARKQLSEECLFYHPIDPLELLGLALAMFYIAKGDVRQAAIGGTNIGRDSDTIAGRAAMLSGALNGIRSIPEEWIRLFKPEVLEKIKNNCELFIKYVVSGRITRLKNRIKLD
ncbi:MAG: ADP-ribosylglycohydrolase family protein [Candidatus Omnitrophica bacterium]|nr:ADP-ribosylglycohydrolase family protein [Candidatus Omnitrophota bacterium]MCM8827671.1 ADP-ribosylglycohydrolase family protein [Candidatus Omnitrophota bacterium]